MVRIGSVSTFIPIPGRSRALRDTWSVTIHRLRQIIKVVVCRTYQTPGRSRARAGRAEHFRSVACTRRSRQTLPVGHVHALPAPNTSGRSRARAARAKHLRSVTCTFRPRQTLPVGHVHASYTKHLQSVTCIPLALNTPIGHVHAAHTKHFRSARLIESM